MPRGGRRYGAGRPRGTLAYSRAAVIEAAQAMERSKRSQNLTG